MSTLSSLLGEPAVSQRTILPPPAPRPGFRLASLRHDPEQTQDDGDGAVAQEAHSRRPATGALDGDCGVRSRVPAGSSLGQYGFCLARPAMSAAGRRAYCFRCLPVGADRRLPFGADRSAAGSGGLALTGGRSTRFERLGVSDRA
jgi:hypothetical protein